MKKTLSPETQQNALAIAKATQKPGQVKEQTKLIAAGVEKGIAEYKKREKAKARERDKARKQQQKAKSATSSNDDDSDASYIETESQFNSLTWSLLGLLILSWALFAAYLFYR
ncbi:DUF2956 domain-containing protein [Shewanella frigidimarina]|uniref:DUF2956 domain-containing protein n=1 Tax=Shewanella frigidimarina (strain NCIMB 400) TaxID=318167 RepID=Q088Z6_SHEFN|nr:DUF2956 domain-containing protein [Shewanella frigidimarina]ABI70169.1 conserved hypothetical protein [Shewanella frigidimarina NCIMB 400]